MDKVLYHPGYNREPWPLFVLSKNADGTLELGTEDKTLIVGKCPVAEVATLGHCTLGEPAKDTKHKDK